MMEPVLDLITSYENRVSTVEELIATAYQATVASQGSLGLVSEERECLVTSLQEMLAKNCSLRKKDFNRFMQMVLSNSDRKRREIEEERNRVREKVNEYLDEQRALANLLREQLLKVARENADSNDLQVILGKIRSSCHEAGQYLLTVLRDYQARIKAFQKEQEAINYRLQRLVERGETLKIEDLRQLEAAKARQERIADRELRREEVDRLLSHFRQRRESRH